MMSFRDRHLVAARGDAAAIFGSRGDAQTMTTLQTSLGALTITRAKPAELCVVMEILDEAAAWLRDKGITKQWPCPMPVSFWEFMEKEIAKGQVYLARLDGNALGTFRFEWTDSELWAHDPDGGGYVHSFAVRNRAHGHRIGATMLAWAKQHVREQGKKYLRLDCWGGNQVLCKYYQAQGFALCGRVPEDGWVSAIFQVEA